MGFNADTAAQAVGRAVGRFTGSYLRDIAAETQRVIARSPDASVDEITAEVMAVLQRNGVSHADPKEVRKAVAEVKRGR